MNVIVILPPEMGADLQPIGLAGGIPHDATPAWEVECLRSHIKQKTKHQCSVIDGRHFTDYENDLIQAVKRYPETQLVAIFANTLSLGQAIASAALTKRHIQDVRCILFGDFPSQFPEHIHELPEIDFAVSGDIEPVLHNLLDFIDMPQRLKRIPGLQLKESPLRDSYWLPRLHSLMISSADTYLESARYLHGDHPFEASLRLSRGHTHLPADRAYGASHEPLRIRPLDRAARMIQNCCAISTIRTVFVSDPPGIWSPERLLQWCNELRRIGNRQPWSFQMLPCYLDGQELNLLHETSCTRIHFVLPSCDPELLERYGCTMDARDILESIHMIQSYEMDVQLHFWMGGPEEAVGEERRVKSMIRALRYPPTVLEPFPFSMDAPLYFDLHEDDMIPHLEDWIAWLRDPWIVERPEPFWGGKEQVANIEMSFRSIQRTIERNPWRITRDYIRHLLSRNWIDSFESWAGERLTHHAGRS